MVSITRSFDGFRTILFSRALFVLLLKGTTHRFHFQNVGCPWIELIKNEYKPTNAMVNTTGDETKTEMENVVSSVILLRGTRFPLTIPRNNGKYPSANNVFL